MRARVLIVDDHAVIRRLVRALLEAQDLEVSDATNGAEGVKKAQEVNPRLIVLDLATPVMNGFEAARALKTLMPDVPPLMFSNNVGAMRETEARSAGICALVSKSAADSSNQLLVCVNALLNRPAKSSCSGTAPA